MNWLRNLFGLPPAVTPAMKGRGLTWSKLRVPDSDGVPDFVWIKEPKP